MSFHSDDFCSTQVNRPRFSHYDGNVTKVVAFGKLFLFLFQCSLTQVFFFSSDAETAVTQLRSPKVQRGKIRSVKEGKKKKTI
jgi:hypothetical protein